MEVKEFSHDVLSTAVDFMYGKDIPEDFNNAKDLEGLLHMADQYLMADLKDAVGARIGKALTKENILETSKMAELFTALKLSEKCADFLIEQKDAVADEDLDGLGGAVLGELGKKAMKEFKKSSWMSKLWGEKVDFKKREDFEADEDYKGYVMRNKARFHPPDVALLPSWDPRAPGFVDSLDSGAQWQHRGQSLKRGRLTSKQSSVCTIDKHNS